MRGDDESFTESAVGHDAQDFEVCAAVACAFFAGVAVAAVHIGFDGAALARFDVGDAWADGDDFDSQLVAWNSGVGIEGHFAEIAGDVRAADAYAMDFDNGFARPWAGGFGDLGSLEMLWFF